jgi:hypothetical protein
MTNSISMVAIVFAVASVAVAIIAIVISIIISMVGVTAAASRIFLCLCDRFGVWWKLG